MSPLAKRLWTKSENNCLTFGVGELWRRPVSLAGQHERGVPVQSSSTHTSENSERENFVCGLAVMVRAVHAAAAPARC